VVFGDSSLSNIKILEDVEQRGEVLRCLQMGGEKTDVFDLSSLCLYGHYAFVAVAPLLKTVFSKDDNSSRGYLP